MRANSKVILNLATNLAYTTALSIVPTFAVVLGILATFRSFEDEVESLKFRLLKNLAPGTGNAIVDRLNPIFDHIQDKSFGIVGLFFMLLTVTWLVTEVDRSFRTIFGAQPRRHLLKRLLAYAIVLIWIPFFAIVLLFWLRKIVAVEIMECLLFFYGWLCLSTIYCLASRRSVRWPAAALGALAAILGLYISKFVYIWINSHLFDYNEFYGALAALPILLIWLRIVWILILGGAQLSRAVRM